MFILWFCKELSFENLYSFLERYEYYDYDKIYEKLLKITSENLSLKNVIRRYCLKFNIGFGLAVEELSAYIRDLYIFNLEKIGNLIMRGIVEYSCTLINLLLVYHGYVAIPVVSSLYGLIWLTERDFNYLKFKDKIIDCKVEKPEILRQYSLERNILTLVGFEIPLIIEKCNKKLINKIILKIIDKSPEVQDYKKLLQEIIRSQRFELISKLSKTK